MSDAAELKKLVKQLQSASTESDIKNVLTILKKDFVINEATLRESKAGLAVGKLRTHATKEVADLAKEIVKKWKGEVEREKRSAQGGSSTTPVANGKPPARKGSMSSQPSTPLSTTGSSSNLQKRTAKIDGVTISIHGDNTREKCAELLYDALASDSGAPVDRILRASTTIEKAAYDEFGGATAVYKNKIRSLFVNLKDKANPGLREGVVSGEIPAEKLPTMTSADMASEERKAADNKIKQDNFFHSLGAEEKQAETDAFQCSRCKQRKCRYRQQQTRSADEPMTTFVTCVNCNNRWKFS